MTHWMACLSRARHSVLDGRHLWGSIEIGLPKQGFRHYRLVVFPPGVTVSDRRRIRQARAWPTWGAVTFVACLVGLSAALGPWTDLMTSAALWLGAGVVVFVRAGEARARVRTLSVVLVDRHYDPRTADTFALLASVAEQLTHADLLLARKEISATKHELIWGLAYDRLGPDQIGSTDRRPPD
jgi:hypothetical protein